MKNRLAWRRSRAWRIARRAWAAAGTAIFLYLMLSFSARGVGAAVEDSDEVAVVEDGTTITFTPTTADPSVAALLLLPGGMVDPHAYAPLLRALAEAGHPAVLVKLPSLGGRAAAHRPAREDEGERR